MLKLKKLSMKNFMSVGNVLQTITLDSNSLTLVLGENLDTGGNSSRNGAGKTTILNAISYALYGNALTNIKKDNLVNKTNQKNMVVVLEFEKNGNTYRIERGRKPAYIKWIVNSNLVNSPDTDEAEGDSRWTQKEIEKVFGLSHTLFKHILALNTYTEPFLGMRANDQRQVIEELLGITQLSQKAEKLKEQIRESKEFIRDEEVKIQAKKESNAAIQRSIDDLGRKSLLWKRDVEKKTLQCQEAIDALSGVNIEEELEAHKKLNEFKVIEDELYRLNKDSNSYAKAITRFDNQLSAITRDLEAAKSHSCPTCKQELHSETHEKITKDLQESYDKLAEEMASVGTEYEEVLNTLASFNEAMELLGPKPTTFYRTIDEAYNHKNTLNSLEMQMQENANKEDPYLEQVASLEADGIQQISFDNLNALVKSKTHQEYLLKLLTDKGSFIRKKIIDQNLSYLNHRLKHYLETLGLPHEVKFQNDLSVEITELGREFDFDNLSRGERNRLILSLSWSFRDVYESMNNPLNLLFIDELVDSGMDQTGVECALEVLKKIARDRGKNIFLISHREELQARVPNIMMVQKENGFTTFSNEVEVEE